MFSRRGFVAFLTGLILLGPTSAAYGVFGFIKRAWSGIKGGVNALVKTITPKPIYKWFKKAVNWAKQTKVGKILRKVWREADRIVDQINALWYEINWNWYFTPPYFPPEFRYGEHFPGDPVYFVNGVDTLFDDATKNIQVLSEVLRRPVYAIHNTSKGRIGDIPVGDFIESLADKVWIPPLPQHSRTTRQIAHLVVKSKRNLSIVSHSQGCLHVLNALLTVADYGRKSQLKKVRWVATGFDLSLMLPMNDMRNAIDDFNPINRIHDPIVQITRANIFGAILATHSSHHAFAVFIGDPIGDFIDERSRENRIVDISRGYAPQVKNWMLWPVELTRKTPRENRTIRVQNLSEQTAELSFVGYQSTHNQHVRFPVRGIARQEVPPRSDALLHTGDANVPLEAAKIWLSVKNGDETIEFGRMDHPMDVAKPYNAEEIEEFPIVLESEKSVTQSWGEPFGTGVGEGKEILWMGVSDKFAFTLDNTYQADAYRHTDQQHEAPNDYYSYTKHGDPSNDKFLVPKSANGSVIRVTAAGERINLYELAPFNIDQWPPGWQVIQDDEDDGLFDPGPRGQYPLGVESADNIHGTMITRVIGETPAARAGFAVGDILVSLNGRAILSSEHSSSHMWIHQGQNVRLGIIRTQSATVDIPEVDPRLGINLRTPGMYVLDITPSGPIARANTAIAPNDRLVAINSMLLTERTDLRAICQQNAGRQVEIRFIPRDAVVQLVDIRLNRVRD
jgi:hypothetical protein